METPTLNLNRLRGSNRGFTHSSPYLTSSDVKSARTHPRSKKVSGRPRLSTLEALSGCSLPQTDKFLDQFAVQFSTALMHSTCEACLTQNAFPRHVFLVVPVFPSQGSIQVKLDNYQRRDACEICGKTKASIRPGSSFLVRNRGSLGPWLTDIPSVSYLRKMVLGNEACRLPTAFSTMSQIPFRYPTSSWLGPRR